MGTKVGRNDPCACGSGKKYKHCCLGREEERERARLHLRAAEAKTARELYEYALDTYGEDLVDAAWDEFWLWQAPRARIEDVPEFPTAFLPWFFFQWVADPEDPDTDLERWPRVPIAVDYLNHKREALDEFERRLVLESTRTASSFHQVERVDPRGTVALRDLLTGAEHEALDRAVAASVREGAILYARFLTLDGITFMVGSAPLVLPPIDAIQVIELRDDVAEGARMLSFQELRECDLETRELYLELADRIRNPRIPELSNTDREQLVPTKLYFDLSITAREAFDRLKSLALGWSDEELLVEAKLDRSGELRRVEIPWVRLGKETDQALQNLHLGRITIEGPRLTAEVNSKERADRIRGEIENRLGEGARFRTAKHESLRKQLEESLSKPESAAERHRREETEELNRRPEVRQALHDMTEKYYAAWLDEPIPALRDQTPREAARSPDGRERLEALLRDMQWRGGGEDALRPDVGKIRRELGLDS